MFAKLGDIEFSNLLGFTGFSESFASEYAEHKKVSGKSKLEYVGESLIETSIQVRLHSQFVNPELVFNTLNTLRKSAEALAFGLGNGEYIGDYVIVSITKTTTQTNSQGDVILMDLDIKLKEYEILNSEDSEKIKAKKAAFATSAKNATAANKYNSNGANYVDSMQEAEGAINSADETLKKAEEGKTTLERAGEAIYSAMEKASAAYDQMDTILAEADELYQLAMTVPAKIEETQDAIAAVQAELPIDDITELRNSMNYVKDKSGNVGTASGDLLTARANQEV